MEPGEWDELGGELEEYPGEPLDTEGWGDVLAPGLSPSVAVARRLLGSRRRPAYRARPYTPPARPMTVQGKVRQLEHQQNAQTAQLAIQQSRSAIRQSSETFGPAATAAVAAFTLAAKQGRDEVFGATLTHGLPILQLLAASRGRAIGAGFRANPIATFAFPAAALLAALLKDQIPGFRKVTVQDPEPIVIPLGARQFLIQVKKQNGAKIMYSAPNAAAGQPIDQLYAGGISITRGQRTSLQAQIGTEKSQVVPISL